MTPPRTQRQSHETPFSVLVEVELRLHLDLRKNLLAVVGHFCRAELAGSVLPSAEDDVSKA